MTLRIFIDVEYHGEAEDTFARPDLSSIDVKWVSMYFPDSPDESFVLEGDALEFEHVPDLLALKFGEVDSIELFAFSNVEAEIFIQQIIEEEIFVVSGDIIHYCIEILGGEGKLEWEYRNVDGQLTTRYIPPTKFEAVMALAGSWNARPGVTNILFQRVCKHIKAIEEEGENGV